jgi:DNA polymerase-1
MKLFLLDGMALIYRAHFAFITAPRITSYGLNTSAVFGLTNTILDLIKKQKPDYLGVVFDTEKPTERHIEFADYKAHREAMPEDLSTAIPYVFRMLECLDIPVITKDGFEADDIIGTLALEAGAKGIETYMMTPDKDFGQLVRHNVFIYKPPHLGNDFTILDEAGVKARWEIDDVSKVIDILGLWGDAVDNIPGIPGIGEKTAKKLIAEYGSMENIFANLDKFKGKQKENLTNFMEQGLLSKRLATINTKVPVKLEDYDLEIRDFNREKVEPFFLEMEFKTLGKRIFGENYGTAATVNEKGQISMFGVTEEKAGGAAVKAAMVEVNIETEIETSNAVPYKTIDDTPHQYQTIATKEERESLLKNLFAKNSICFDTETTGTDANVAEIVGMSFSFENQKAFYIPLPEKWEEARAILEEFRPLFESEKIQKIGQNIKYDYMILQRYGIGLKGDLFDTMLAHYLIEPDQRHGMDALSEKYLRYSPVSIETLIGKRGKQISFRDVPVDKATEYAAEDADVTWQLKNVLEKEKNFTEVKRVFDEVEMPLVKVLAHMEMEGVKIDANVLGVINKELQQDIKVLEQEIYNCCGEVFNIGSPRQLGVILFEKLKLDPKAKKTKTGQYQTGEDVLQYLAYEHEVAQKIMDYRQLEKLRGTYVDALPQMINPNTGRVHTSFNQAVAATGRLSSNNPNLQNIPIRTERGREVRKAFVPRDAGHILLSADYSQIELRIIAAMAHDESMIQAFADKIDIHTATASKVFGVPIAEVNKDMRRKAKSVNFGIIYGISAFGLAAQLGISRAEAKEIIETYFRQFPNIRNYMNEAIESARELGYVKTIMGRRRYLRDINSANATVRGFAERNAINAPIQGSAADMIKVAMINIHHELEKRGLQSKMVLQVHDELVFDVYKPELEEMKSLIHDKMVNAIPLNVIIEAEMGTGENWLEAH